MQRPALWISWLPWIVLPFILTFGRAFHFALALVFPGLAALSPLAPPEALAVYAVALLLDTGTRYAYGRAHTAGLRA